MRATASSGRPVGPQTIRAQHPRCVVRGTHRTMEHYSFNDTYSSRAVNHSELQQWYTKQVLASSRHWEFYLNVGELLLAALALLINLHLISSILFSSKGPYRTFSLSLLNLSLGQSLVCVSSLVVTVGTLLSDDPISPPTALIAWRSFMQNLAVGFFCGLCLSGTAVLTWTHWWFTTNINPCQWLISSVWEKVVAIVLWVVSILVTARLQLADTSILSFKFDGRVMASYSTVYGIVFFIAGGIVTVSCSTVISFIPHRFTLRKTQPTPVSAAGHECGADCPCSESETLSPDFRRSRQLKSIRSAPNPSRISPVVWQVDQKSAGSVRCQSADYLSLPFQKNQNKEETSLVAIREPIASDRISDKTEAAESELIFSDTISVCSNDHLADGSSSCSPIKMIETGHKLPLNKLQERLIQLNSIRQIRPESPPSPKADSVHTFRSYQRRRKEIRQPRTGFRLVAKKPKRNQRIAIGVFIGLYLPPLILFVAATWSQYGAILMEAIRLLFNLVNCVNPYFCCVQYPSLRLRMLWLRRKIHPATNGCSSR